MSADGFGSPGPSVSTPPSDPTYDAPSQPNLVAVAATVSVVGVLMAVLLTWLVLRLRRVDQSQTIPVSRRPTSYAFRPSFAPSEASSKFGFIRKPIRLSHRQKDTSWDFADPDPFAHPKESPFDSTFPAPPSPKHRPAPLPLTPAYIPRAHRTSMYKDESGLLTPTTPATPDYIDSPPPAYCRDGNPWPRPLSHPKDGAPS